MAIYTTIFTATDAELMTLFGNWRQPLMSPKEVSRTFPFGAGKTKTIVTKTRDPSAASSTDSLPSLKETHDRPFIPPAMEPDGKYADYQRWLEEQSPPALRTLPHVAMKGITQTELEELGEILIGGEAAPARFLDCRDKEGVCGAIQAAAIPLLGDATDEQLKSAAEKWCEVLNSGRPEDAYWVLLRLRVLARDAASRNANLFSHTLV